MSDIVDFSSKRFKEARDAYDFDAEAYSATYRRVHDALGGEPLQRGMGVLANMLIEGALMAAHHPTPENAKQFLTSLISGLIDAYTEKEIARLRERGL
jgi:hypothetical protein